MQEKLIYVTGGSDEEIKTQYEQCMELFESRRGEHVPGEVKTRHLRKLQQKTTIPITIGDEVRVHLVADRMDIQFDGMGAATAVNRIFGRGVTEMIVADAKEYILNAEQIKEYLRKTNQITIASKRVAFESGASSEHVHRVMSMLKEPQKTRDGEEVLKDTWSGGRPPVGTEAADGQLIKADDYHDVREILQQVVFNDLPKSEASRRIGCTRKTITNTINRRHELFDIPQQ